jgi:hypothetical protein
MGEESWVKTTPDECKAAIERELRARSDERIAMGTPADPANNIGAAQRHYHGIIDGIRDSILYGWCRLIGADDPVELELFADERFVRRLRAKEFRPDLRDAGFGMGKHGFFFDLRELDLTPAAVIRVKVSNYGIELENSGRPVWAYGT